MSVLNALEALEGGGSVTSRKRESLYSHISCIGSR